MEAVLSKCYRTDEGYYRVRIVPDPACESPREADNAATLLTWESSYHSPDSRAEIPEYLTTVIDQWCGAGRDFNKPVNAAKAANFCRQFRSDQVYAVGGLSRAIDDSLILDADPGPGVEYDGLALVTRAGWERAMGSAAPCTQLAEILLRQELDVYNDWQAGANYGYEVERFDGDAWVDHESCYGFIGDPEGYVLTAALDTLQPDPVEVDEDTVRSAVLEKSSYVLDLEGVIEGFRFNLCEMCGNDLELHLIGPDPLGKPHLWCLASGEAPTCPKDNQSFDEHFASGIRLGRQEALDAVRTVSGEPARLAIVLAAASAYLERPHSSEEHA